MARYLNIEFPLKESDKGFFLSSTVSTKEQVRSELALLITTKKGERLFKPNFGTNLYAYLFEPLDETTKKAITEEIKATVSYNMASIEINSITYTEQSSQMVGITVNYSISDGVFKQQDTLDLVF